MTIPLARTVAAMALALASNIGIAQGTEADVAGTYDGIAGHRALMVISKVQSRFHVVFDGGAQTGGGAAVSADCEAVAEGEWVNGTVRAKMIPFKGKDYSLDADAIKRMDPEVLISFKKGVAEVEGSFDHCGLGNALYGKYKKRKK